MRLEMCHRLGGGASRSPAGIIGTDERAAGAAALWRNKAAGSAGARFGGTKPPCRTSIQLFGKREIYPMSPAFLDPSVRSRHFGKTKYPFFCKRIHGLVEGSKSPRRFGILPKAAARAARRSAMVK